MDLIGHDDLARLAELVALGRRFVLAPMVDLLTAGGTFLPPTGRRQAGRGPMCS